MSVCLDPVQLVKRFGSAVYEAVLYSVPVERSAGYWPVQTSWQDWGVAAATIVKTRGASLEQTLACCVPVDCHVRGHVQLHPGYPLLSKQWQPHRTQMFALLVQGGRRNQGWVTIRPKQTGVIVPKGSPRCPHPLRMSLLSLPSPPCLRIYLVLFLSVLLSPFHQLFWRNVLRVWMPLTFGDGETSWGTPLPTHILEAGVSLLSCEHPDL